MSNPLRSVQHGRGDASDALGSDDPIDLDNPVVADGEAEDCDIDIVLRAAILALTLGTAYIHLTLGGLLFTLTAVGYTGFAVALIVPLALAERFRWPLRLGLVGYTLSVIAGWVLDGPRYDVAYITKGIELALIVLLAVDFARRDGSPIDRIRQLLGPRIARPHGPASGRA